jgi:ABC-type phosphonate transport system ATPase subunit
VPNGIAFSPDEKTLYIANYETSRPVWMAFEVSAVGTISNGRVFFDATAWMKTKLGLPDGLKVDKEGNLFATGPGGLHVFARSGRTDRQDEPTASLDGVTGREIVDLLQGLARGEGCALILIAHDQRILSIADRLLHLEDMVCSRKEALGRTHQSRNPPKLYLRSGGGSFDGTSAPVG